MTHSSSPPEARPVSPSADPVGDPNDTLNTDQDNKREQAHDVFGIGAQFSDGPEVTNPPSEIRDFNLGV